MIKNIMCEELGRIKSAIELRDYANFLAYEATLDLFKKEAEKKMEKFKKHYTHVVSLEDFSLISVDTFDEYMLFLLDESNTAENVLEPYIKVIELIRKTAFVGVNIGNLDLGNGAVKNSWQDYIRYMITNNKHELTKESFYEFEDNIELLFGGFWE